jgi:hypothetical protein
MVNGSFQVDRGHVFACRLINIELSPATPIQLASTPLNTCPVRLIIDGLMGNIRWRP